ncbi:hypothetical protein J6590_089922 [Homalodisca vitripennis]|nr:hypothetical protein J6590_089922 [Homalodisca vitripennis]
MVRGEDIHRYETRGRDNYRAQHQRLTRHLPQNVGVRLSNKLPETCKDGYRLQFEVAFSVSSLRASITSFQSSFNALQASSLADQRVIDLFYLLRQLVNLSHLLVETEKKLCRLFSSLEKSRLSLRLLAD